MQVGFICTLCMDTTLVVPSVRGLTPDHRASHYLCTSLSVAINCSWFSLFKLYSGSSRVFPLVFPSGSSLSFNSCHSVLDYKPAHHHCWRSWKDNAGLLIYIQLLLVIRTNMVTFFNESLTQLSHLKSNMSSRQNICGFFALMKMKSYLSDHHYSMTGTRLYTHGSKNERLQKS